MMSAAKAERTAANDRHNTMSPIEATIASIMNDATSSMNKQANLVVALFNNNVSFDNKTLLDMLRLEQTDRTKARENLLCAACHEYAKALAILNTLKEKGKKDRTEKENFQIETLFNKIRAANIMFERAAITVIGLRDNGAQQIKTSAVGAGALEVKSEDQDGDLVKERMSCATALSGAQRAVNKLLGKKEDQTASRMCATIDSVTRFLDINMKAAADKEGFSLADFGNTTEKALEELFARLFALKFGVADDVDTKDVKQYAEQIKLVA
jgi:hypothetical protein